jgi:hypothetical protein
MAITISLSNELIEQARRYGNIQHRSVPKQIEYWCCIGRTVVENPDLPYSFIENILIAQEEESIPFTFESD